MLDVLRAAGEPLRCCEITRRVLAAKGWPMAIGGPSLAEKCGGGYLRRGRQRGMV